MCHAALIISGKPIKEARDVLFIVKTMNPTVGGIDILNACGRIININW